MHVSLTSELESRIKAKVESGLYNNASEVIREALRFMDTHEDWIHEVKLARLREQLQIGTALRLNQKRLWMPYLTTLRPEPNANTPTPYCACSQNRL